MTAIGVSNLLLWFAVIALALITLVTLRQVGVISERIAPAGALMMNRRLSAGETAPNVSARNLFGDPVTVGHLVDDQRCMLLFFLSPGCSICKLLLPVVASLVQDEHEWLDVMFVGDGADNDHMTLAAENNLDKKAYLLSETVGKAYGVSRLPYAVLIDERARIAAFGIVNTREHLESLVEAKIRRVGSIQEYMREHGSKER